MRVPPVLFRETVTVLGNCLKSLHFLDKRRTNINTFTLPLRQPSLRDCLGSSAFGHITVLNGVPANDEMLVLVEALSVS